MLATEQFKMRISPEEKAMLADLARHFQRSQADTLKTLVREVWHLMKDKNINLPANCAKKEGSHVIEPPAN